MTLLYLLDTNIISEPIKKVPDKQVLEKIECHYSVCALSAFTVFEMIKGAYQLAESQKRSKVLRYTEKTFFQLPILPYTQNAGLWHGKETARLQSMGKSPPFIDAQIASIAVTNNLILVTRNTEDFKYFTELRLENWFI